MVQWQLLFEAEISPKRCEMFLLVGLGRLSVPSVAQSLLLQKGFKVRAVDCSCILREHSNYVKDYLWKISQQSGFCTCLILRRYRWAHTTPSHNEWSSVSWRLQSWQSQFLIVLHRGKSSVTISDFNVRKCRDVECSVFRLKHGHGYENEAFRQLHLHTNCWFFQMHYVSFLFMNTVILYKIRVGPRKSFGRKQYKAGKKFYINIKHRTKSRGFQTLRASFTTTSLVRLFQSMIALGQNE